MKSLRYVQRGKYINPNKVPFQEILPLKLKTSVSGKSDTSSKAVCVQEMSILFSCLKNNNFNDVHCSKETTEFQKCWKQFAAEHDQKKIQERQGILEAGVNRLSHKQTSQLLKQYPGPKK